MLAKVCSGAVYGVEAYPVEIEVNLSHGDPQTVIVGLPNAAVKESKDRVFTAVRNSGFKPHTGRVTINLAPADIKKEGPDFDLPIAIGLLAANDDIDHIRAGKYGIIGELALSGEVHGQEHTKRAIEVAVAGGHTPQRLSIHRGRVRTFDK